MSDDHDSSNVHVRLRYGESLHARDGGGRKRTRARAIGRQTWMVTMLSFAGSFFRRRAVGLLDLWLAKSDGK